jgi:hypothetical protein
MEQDNLTSKHLDANGKSRWAIYLPALSSFYSGYIGKQRFENHVDPARMPQAIPDMEQLNWLNDQKALFPYKWSLYSAGHANLDVNKQDPKEDMVRNRDPNTFLLGDSGGFQIGKGVWEGNWTDPNCPKAQKKRELVLSWMDTYMDRGMILDIPVWVADTPAKDKVGVHSFDDAVTATYINNEYFMANRTGRCKFLNVLQGRTFDEANDWYDRMKKYCDPKQYAKPFEGWAMGGRNMSDVHLILTRLVTMYHEGFLQEGLHDWMHFLGTSKLEWAVLLTDIQNAVRRHYNPNFTISFDCASPFLATANGQVYYDIATPDRGKWAYKMDATVDDKKYATDSRDFIQTVIDDKIHKTFISGPISSRLKIKDICHYAPGMLNKIGKEGRTSWDSFSYALLMGHNVWTHIEAVRQANEAYEAGNIPKALVQETFERVMFKDVVEEIFSQPTLQASLDIIDHHNKFWTSIRGQRNNKETALEMFGKLFTVEDNTDDEEETLDESKLDDLETGEEL